MSRVSRIYMVVTQRNDRSERQNHGIHACFCVSIRASNTQLASHCWRAAYPVLASRDSLSGSSQWENGTVVLGLSIAIPASSSIDPDIIDVGLAVILDLRLAPRPIAPRSTAAHYTRTWLEEDTWLV